MRTRTPLAAIAAAALLVLPACGGDDDEPTAPAAVPETQATPESPETEPEETTVPPAEVPTVDVPDGPPPGELQITEVTEGDGLVAESGDLVSVDYVGVLYEAPDEPFDESYSRGQPIEFEVGGGVIEGFSAGVDGMQVGGRRQVVIPPEQGYGEQGAGGVIPPGATLVFVMDLRDVQKGG
jgi:peptidylprolyl isomerase